MPKKPEKKKPSTGSTDRAPVTNDARFASVHSDPRFAMPRRKDAKIAIDKRFTRMLKDDDFAQKASVDRYGRKLAKDAGKAEIKRYYRLDNDDDSDAEGSGSEDEEDEEDEGKPRYDPARGEGVISSSDDDSSSEDEEEEEVDAAEEDQIARQLLQREEIPTGDVTARFAAVNLDWDHVAAVDLMAAFSSFAPSGGRVLRVTVYPSEFGRERMERENMEGPPSEIFRPKKKKEDDDEEEEDIDPDEEVTVKTLVKEDKGEEFDSAKLRNYQLERLRYYYAVVECDRPETAHHIYEQCDGAEYEATANFFDLRFIPDDTSFEDDTPRDTCTEAPANYKPNDFVTDALQHSKVKLTWDADDTARQTAAKRAFSQKEVEEMDVKAYLASSDSESDAEGADNAAAKEKYRALLSGSLLAGKGSKKKDDGGPTGDMEITFTSGLSAKEKGAKVIEDADDDGDGEPAETTIEKYARKEKERKQRRKEKSKLLREGDGTAADADEEEAGAAPAAVDLGFDDPFFAADPVAVNPKKEKKAKAKAQRAAEAAEAAAKRGELEALMADADRDGLNHFDMKQVVKAEKAGKGKHGKKGKKRSRQAEEALEEGMQKGFEIDVADERFKAVFERNEFAIDPTNPRFVKTKAMDKLLGERQRRGKMTGGKGEEGEERQGKRKKVKVGAGAEGGAKSDEVKRLVQSLKSKSKQGKK
ncbi:uncharacterized protein LAJ45_00588 [Morchella importuna]|uniref:uncharacterized protein n=1 Tax=Morchella importuna TaxID=1174673 RepID=UPI001E8EA6C8|nr:uncharacterized protein LAJ45_00588 [Morchella importuna]KAH8155578.1 hypothetical protein LAJ45_00588 [Morchella importuna]